MIDRRTWWLIGAAGAVPLSMLAGFLWHSGFEPEYVAYARISVPTSVINTATAPHGSFVPTVEEVILSPENVTAAADLVRSRGIILSTVSPLESDVEELMRRVDAGQETGHEQPHDYAEVRVSYQTPDAEQAIPVLSAVLDACISALDRAAPRVDETAAASREAERHDLAVDLAMRQEALAELEQRARRIEASQLDATLLADRIHSLESSLARAREERVAAEDRLADIHQQLGAGFTAEQIAEKLPAGPHSATHDQVATTRAREELKQQLDLLDRAATIYGRNHPRLIKIRSEVDRLKYQAGVVQASAQTDDAPLSPAAVLLQAQEALLTQATTAEQELVSQLERTVADRKSRIDLDEQVARTRDEITPLKDRHDELNRQIEAAAREADSRKTTICEPPALAPEALVPSITQYLAWGGFVGLVFAGGFWHKSRTPSRTPPTPILLSGPKLPVVVDWGKPATKPALTANPAVVPAAIPLPVPQKSVPELPNLELPAPDLPVQNPPHPELTIASSDKSPASSGEHLAEVIPSKSALNLESPPASEGEPESPLRPRERFRSQEEENLARLKRLSMQTA